jgi:hypothetical protein
MKITRWRIKMFIRLTMSNIKRYGLIIGIRSGITSGKYFFYKSNRFDESI